MSTKWDQRFLALAKHIAGWSKDPSTQCGAVIVDQTKRIISTGYNGLPRGTDDLAYRLENREIKYKIVVHAEENALLYARQDIAYCTLYVWPLRPCGRCAAKIIQCGIVRVVTVDSPLDVMQRWSGDWELSQRLYQESGVKLDVVKLEG